MFHLAMGILSCFLFLSHRQSEFYHYIFFIDLVLKPQRKTQAGQNIFQAFIVK
jgi:hypothetical protein